MLPHYLLGSQFPDFRTSTLKILRGGPLIPLILFSISLALLPLCFPQLSHHDPSHVITKTQLSSMYFQGLCAPS